MEGPIVARAGCRKLEVRSNVCHVLWAGTIIDYCFVLDIPYLKFRTCDRLLRE